MSKKTINCLVVLNATEEYVDSNSKVKQLYADYVPKGSCPQVVHHLCVTSLGEVASKLDEAEHLGLHYHMVIQYGLGNGLLWESDTLSRGEDLLEEIPSINCDYALWELFNAADKKVEDEIFPKLKSFYYELDNKMSWPDRVKTCRTKDDMKYILDRCMTESYGLDTETNFLNPFIRDPEPFLVCFSVAWHSDEEECWVIPTCQKLIEDGHCEFTLEESHKLAEQVFFESPQPQDWQNFHYDGLVLWELFGGRRPKNFRCDTMLLFSIYHKAMKSASLASNVVMLGLPEYKEAAKEWIASQPKKKKGQPPYTFADVPIEIIGPYAAVDALAVVRGVNFMKKHLSPEQWTFYYTIAHEVLLCSIELCIEGYEISRDRYLFTKVSVERQMEKAFTDCIEVVKDHVDKHFNINSNDQLAELMFNKLGLPVLHKTDGGSPSVGAKVLDDLILFHPFIFYLAKLKKLNKLYTSYVLSYTNVMGGGTRLKKTNSKWVLNTQLKQINRTARLSSSNLYGHEGTKKKGGSLLTLPGAGSMVKHYFCADEVVSLENELYEGILLELKAQDKDKYNAVILALSQNGTLITKPEPLPKPPKPPKPPKEVKPKKSKTKAAKEAEITEITKEDQTTEIEELPWA